MSNFTVRLSRGSVYYVYVLDDILFSVIYYYKPGVCNTFNWWVTFEHCNNNRTDHNRPKYNLIYNLIVNGY